MRSIFVAALIGAALAWALPADAATWRTLDGRAMTPAAIDTQVGALLQAGHVEGLGLALIHGGKVVYLKTYGAAGASRPLTPDTVTYGASLSKATFAYLVMQLVDEGRIDLDKPIAEYLPKPLPAYPAYAALEGDPRWRRLTFRILLDHTPGFANFGRFEPDGKLRFHWDPGTRFAYSGEGLNLAQFVLETGLGFDVGKEMQRRIFDRFGMTRTAMTWRPDFAANAADVYLADGSVRPHRRRGGVQAAGSMDTTVRDWSAFLAGVARGEGLSRRSKAEMIRRQIAIRGAAQFPTLTSPLTDDNAAIGLGYGLGWGVFETPYGHAFFKEGHDDGTGNYALCVAARRDCILLMSNSDHAEGVFKALVEDLLGPVNLPWKWENYIPFEQGGPQR